MLCQTNEDEVDLNYSNFFQTHVSQLLCLFLTIVVTCSISLILSGTSNDMRHSSPIWSFPYSQGDCSLMSVVIVHGAEVLTDLYMKLLVHELWPLRTGIQFQLKCRKLAGWNHLTFCRELSPIRCPFPQTRQ